MDKHALDLAVRDILRANQPVVVGLGEPPHEATGTSAAYPFLTVYPLVTPVDQSGDLTGPPEGAVCPYDIRATGLTWLSASVSLNTAVTVLVGKTSGVYTVGWPNTGPQPCERAIVQYGPPDSEPKAGCYWASIELHLTVL